MNIHELWFILTKLSNKNKLILIKKYKSEENIKNNWEKILNNNFYKDKLLDRKEITIDELNLFEKYIKENGIGYITINSKKYPQGLKNIEEPPYVLFYKGDIQLLNEKIGAIVGSRNYTNYGAEITKVISRELALNNIAVISGAAKGVDSIAHNTVLKEGGKTIGVLGCGIDVVYPKNNKKLYNEIIKNGLLISEFLPKTPPFSYNFPRRNRIISALSSGVVVVEASIKSGSLITANYAAEQGKSVLAIPGSVFQKNSDGCNRLIADGANIFCDIDDLYTFFNIIKNRKESIYKNTYKNKLLDIINDEPKHLDDILEGVNVDRKVVFGLLFEMQNRNEIICLPGNYYAKSL
ncbi:DNA-processing protein DprA [Clostridium carnis]